MATLSYKRSGEIVLLSRLNLEAIREIGVENDFHIASQYCLPHTCLYANVKVLVKRKKPKIQKGGGQE